MYNSKLFTQAPKHYNARQLSTHLIFTANLSSMVITADPSCQPPLSSCAIACYRGAADGGGDGVKGMESCGNKICKWLFNSVKCHFVWHLLLNYCRVSLGMNPFKIGEGVEQLWLYRTQGISRTWMCLWALTCIQNAYTVTDEGSAIPVCVCGPWVY